LDIRDLQTCKAAYKVKLTFKHTTLNHSTLPTREVQSTTNNRAGAEMFATCDNLSKCLTVM